MDQEIPKIKKVVEIGETPFQFIAKEESILQGWDAKIRKTIYLFKTDSGNWGYYDKETSQVIDVTQWKEKAAWVGDHYVKMSLYHRIIIRFAQPLNYSGWDPATRREVPVTTTEAMVVVTDSAYKQIVEQLNGRPADSFLKFQFTTRKIQNRQSTYIDKVVWVS